MGTEQFFTAVKQSCERERESESEHHRPVEIS